MSYFAEPRLPVCIDPDILEFRQRLVEFTICRKVVKDYPLWGIGNLTNLGLPSQQAADVL